MTYSKIALGVATLALAASAHADVAVTLDAGTTGIGAHLVVPMETYLNGRFGFNYLDHDRTDTAGNLEYAFKTKLQTYDILFDWYPMSPQFHLTAGLVYNNNQVRATAKPNGSGTYTINGTTYSASDFGTLAADIDYHKAAPYLGVGWGNALTPGRKWNLKIDIGAFLQGKPSTNLVALGCTTSTTICNKLTADTKAENVKLAEEFNSYRAYPVVRLSASYAF
jgi:hypothetical protein